MINIIYLYFKYKRVINIIKKKKKKTLITIHNRLNIGKEFRKPDKI